MLKNPARTVAQRHRALDVGDAARNELLLISGWEAYGAEFTHPVIAAQRDQYQAFPLLHLQRRLEESLVPKRCPCGGMAINQRDTRREADSQSLAANLSPFQAHEPVRSVLRSPQLSGYLRVASMVSQQAIPLLPSRQCQKP